MAHAEGVTRADEPVLVTTAAKSPREEQRDRQRRYLLTMALRVVCLVLAIVLFGVGLRWLAAFAVAGSLVLPWIAVVAANAGPRRTVERPALYARRRPKAIEPPED
jgi:small neutral amino acid transporter SnatA (MarC family)